MPYKSKNQAAYFNIHKKKLEKQGVDVDEWNAASQGLSLPKQVKKHQTLREADFRASQKKK